MNYLISILYDLAPYIHFVSFGLLLLAGLNLPVSEDLIFIISASIAATLARENTVYILIACVSGALLSDIMAFLIGKYFAAKIIKHKFVRKFIPTEKINTIAAFYKKYGNKTLFFGRFIPFGVRNAIFMTAGLVDVKLKRFVIIDSAALVITSTILFSLGYKFGENYTKILSYVGHIKVLIAIIVLIIIIVKIIIYYIRKKSKLGKIYLLK